MLEKRIPRSKRARTKKLPDYRHLGCPMSRAFLLWCYGTCKPQHGIGACGRLYPWQFKSMRQRAIARFKAEEASSTSESTFPRFP